MNIVILCKSNPFYKNVDPNSKIYDYMSKIFEMPKNSIIVKISPTENIDKEDYFSKFKNANTSHIAFYVYDSNGCSLEYVNPQFKKSTSITEYGYCSQENDETSLSRTQINNSSKIFYEDKLEQIITMTRNISQQNFDSGSVKSLQNNMCTFCMVLIEEASIETSCFHYFHTNCFKLIIENQLFQKAPILNCLCKMQLNLKSLLYLDDKYEAESFKHRFILNQLSALEKNIQNQFGNEFRKCKNVKSCNFFYMHLPFIQKQHEFCPNCLWHSDK
ncbi:unnamed protein product [Paramecium octaurelia]|uniref:RING-type domain-containing protein n=1 Tax=Paramecium octaurelia TaxID=43137 RepID=A0A8S1WYT7_PAROT|nr:unnamed protein product [Paramecium octaurelia]